MKKLIVLFLITFAAAAIAACADYGMFDAAERCPANETRCPEQVVQTGDPCNGIDFIGVCDGDLLRWCDDAMEGKGKEIMELDCGAEDLRCGFDDDKGLRACLDDNSSDGSGGTGGTTTSSGGSGGTGGTGGSGGSGGTGGTGGGTGGVGGFPPGTYYVQVKNCDGNVANVNSVFSWSTLGGGSGYSWQELSCSFSSGIKRCALPNAPSDEELQVHASMTLSGGGGGNLCYTDPGDKCGYKLRCEVWLEDPDGALILQLGVAWNQESAYRCESCNAAYGSPLACNPNTTNCVP